MARVCLIMTECLYNNVCLCAIRKQMCSNSYFLITGFENAATACCGTGLFEMGYICDKRNPFTCSDANEYVFWDSFHPTEKTNGIIGDYVLKTSLAQFF